MTNAIVGYDVPAQAGMHVRDVATPALLIDLDAFERNVATLRDFVAQNGIRLRAHAKTHKCADIARYQIENGGACGICCQKVSEAEALANAGIRDILITNQVVDQAKIHRLAMLAGKCRAIVCVDDACNVRNLSEVAQSLGVTIECLVEIDVGAGRCGVAPGGPACELATSIAKAPGLKFSGLQAYNGSAQHLSEASERKARIDDAAAMVRDTIEQLKAAGFDCDIVGGAGTGTYPFESASGVYNELQCGSYIFMDVDYQTVKAAAGEGPAAFENALFVLTSVMSQTKPGLAICDAGLKAHSVDSGLPTVFERPDLTYQKCSDEHGVIADPGGTLALNDRLRLVPGHCDPTCNLYDWFVGVRGDIVACVWPVTARGKGY